MSKTFGSATQERTEEGWLKYPRDATERKMAYGTELYEQAVRHPAKMNLYVCRDIVDYVSNRGETIVDPFGGIGTTMLAGCLTGRNVYLIEVEEAYVEIAQAIYDKWIRDNTPGLGMCLILCKDNRQVLPLPCDHIITSPPYGSDLFKEDSKALRDDLGVEQYGTNPLNIGRLNSFLYVQIMDKLYEKMFDSVRPGGTISITHRDRTRAGKRILYSKSIINSLTKRGMKLEVWEKWKAPMSIQGRVNESMGIDVIADEDIMIFRKPQ